MGSSCSSELGCSRSSAVAPERRRAGGPSGGGGSSSRTEDDEDATTYSSSASRSRIRTARLAAEVAPFLPRRVISAFLSGRLHGNGFERTSGAAMPVPREMQGALLLVSAGDDQSYPPAPPPARTSAHPTRRAMMVCKLALPIRTVRVARRCTSLLVLFNSHFHISRCCRRMHSLRPSADMNCATHLL